MRWEYSQRATCSWASSLRPFQRNLLANSYGQSHKQECAQESTDREKVCSGSMSDWKLLTNQTQSLLLTLRYIKQVKRVAPVADIPSCNDNAFHQPLSEIRGQEQFGKARAQNNYQMLTQAWKQGKNPLPEFFGRSWQKYHKGCFKQQFSHPAVPEIYVSITRHERAGMFHYWGSN